MSTPEAPAAQADNLGDDEQEPPVRNEDLFSALVLPVSRFGPGKHGEPEPIAAVGTGFTFGEQTFVTCWHCVRDPLGEGEFYAAVGRSEGTDGQDYDRYFELQNLERDRNGSDLALARVDYTVPTRLALASQPPGWGQDVMACGYPLPLNTRDAATREPLINTNAMLFKGYVIRIRNADFPGQPETRMYELDMPAPPGLSGSPVLLPDSREVVGVLVTERGYGVPGEPRTIYFAYAHHLWVLRAASGTATGNLPLGQFLGRDV